MQMRWFELSRTEHLGAVEADLKVINALCEHRQEPYECSFFFGTGHPRKFTLDPGSESSHAFHAAQMFALGWRVG